MQYGLRCARVQLQPEGLMVIVDATIVNVALPAIGRGLGGGVCALQWVVDAFTVVFAGLLLSAGSLGDRLGGPARVRALG